MPSASRNLCRVTWVIKKSFVCSDQGELVGLVGAAVVVVKEPAVMIL